LLVHTKRIGTRFRVAGSAGSPTHLNRFVGYGRVGPVADLTILFNLILNCARGNGLEQRRKVTQQCRYSECHGLSFANGDGYCQFGQVDQRHRADQPTRSSNLMPSENSCDPFLFPGKWYTLRLSRYWKPHIAGSCLQPLVGASERSRQLWAFHGSLRGSFGVWREITRLFLCPHLEAFAALKRSPGECHVFCGRWLRNADPDRVVPQTRLMLRRPDVGGHVFPSWATKPGGLQV